MMEMISPQLVDAVGDTLLYAGMRKVCLLDETLVYLRKTPVEL